ncbi:SDR family NAD(P)-dependent oxidoreductase [Ornithinimicrobium pratense]|uniref:SDR family NAD(P)-dependent oxidoreductase n=1 Tax=Ornithinimicrobium pratense TaxID=2593973 RepID=A0A5J6V9N6_9MICO|nr:SDR family NAD(P)-dependent oxidoreductase [Ornithinimicrobium pratense]QFG69926.1 SDR family NAD(P)-dependent oxidoreductase [Ornithinimicrobium pratense]
MQVQNKVFVVTGAGNGIGREVVLDLLRRGGRVAAVDLREESLVDLGRRVRVGERLTLHTLDITERRSVESLPEQVLQAHGHIDGLLNVAGIIQEFVPFADLSYEQMERVLGVNLWGVVHTSKAFLPHLVERPEACLVNVSSMGGFAPVPGQTMYGASKAAVKLLTEGLYAELRQTPVAVTIVFPGAIETEITSNSGVRVPGRTSPEEAALQGVEDGAKDAKHRTMPARDAARKIVEDAVKKGQYRVIVGRDAAMLDRLSRLAPQRATDLVAKQMAHLLG